MAHGRILVLCAVAVTLAIAAPVPLLRPAWQLKIGDESRLPHDIQGLRFSWDGKWLAAVVCHLRTEDDAPPNELVIAPVSGDPSAVLRMNVREELLSTPQHAGIHWSPGGDYLALETKHFSTIVLRVRDRKRCELPRTTVFGGFAGPDRMIAADWELPKDPAYIPASFSTLTFYGTDCRPIESMKMQGQIRQIEGYAPAGIVAMHPEQAGIRVLSMSTRKGIGGLGESGDTMLRFGDKGSVLCRADAPGRGSLACYEVATGDRTAHPDLVGGAPMDVSAENSIVVAGESGSTYDLNTGRFGHKFRRWIVWDYRAQRELAHLPYKGPRRGYEASPAAITPDGRFVAVGAGAELRVYEMPKP